MPAADLLNALSRQLWNVTYTLAALAALVVVARSWPRIGPRWFSPVERALSRLARRRALSVLLVGMLSLLVGLSLTWIAGPPIPHVHDEFSYLLMADTFASGRLTNPPHPMWRHFETMHVIFHPTYASKFHPAQGLLLAFGQAVFGAPWVGAVVGVALGCAALAWALFAWVRPTWALVGGLICTIHPQVVIWSHHYWGGGVGMIGGALVLGALGRIIQNQHIGRNAALLALGGAVLAASRPYEAIVWALLSAATLLGWLFVTRRRGLLRLAGRVALPAAAVLVPFVAMLGYYNWRVTESPAEFPYTLHSRMYMAVPLMFWQQLPEPKIYNNPQLHDQHQVFEWEYFFGQYGFGPWLRGAGYKLYFFVELHLLRNLALLVGLAAVPWALCAARRLWLAGLFAAGFLVAYGMIPWFEHHYPGAAMGVVFVLALQGLRLVRTRRAGGHRWGQTFVWLCIVSMLLVLPTVFQREYRNARGGWWFEREMILRHLESQPGKHLVFVHYEPHHPSGHEWVYNAADIDAAKVVWARRLGEAHDRSLMEYYPNRRLWVVYADQYPARLERLRR